MLRMRRSSRLRSGLLLGLINGRYGVQMVASLSTTAAWPAAASGKHVWRPTIDDVDRISWGRPAKKKGTGSRGVPHRLNDEERVLYDLARGKGFVEVSGSGWRRERSDAPLINTYRSWCDARAIAFLCLHKGGQTGRGQLDELILDLSPLRTPAAFADAAAFCLSADGAADGILKGFEEGLQLDLQQDEEGDEDGEAGEARELAAGTSAEAILAARRDDFETKPIHRLPKYVLAWERPRSEAKALAKALAMQLGTAEAKVKGRAKALGGPRIKPGKSRQHGGYGIG